MENFEILVIGGGPAAITIAKILGKKKNVGVIRPEDHSMIYCAMPYAIEGIVCMEKTLKSDSLVTDAGAKLIRDKVNSVDFDQKTIQTEGGRAIGYEQLIIATGSNPFLPPIEGINYKGVHVFKSEHDLKQVNEAVKEKKLKKAVVVGAGAIGVELALALQHCGLETHIVDMVDSVLPNLLDPDMTGPAENQLAKAGLKLHLGQKTERIVGDGKAEQVILDNGEVIDLTGENSSYGIVVFCVGMRAGVEIFSDTKLEIGRIGIVIDNKMRTNIPDVYALGDCAQFVSGITGEISEGKLATNAVPMARMLAKNILGADREYKGFFNGAATRVGDVFVGGTGLSEQVARGKYNVVTGVAELTTTFPIMPEAKPVKMKLVADADTMRVLGAQVVSGSPVADKIDTITLAIQNELTINDLTEFSYSAQPYQSFFPANNLIIACSEEILSKTRE